MFPTENPSPCCPQTSQPRICSSIGDDDEEVDLCNESENTPLLPNFSLRDYVSSNRRKGIANHWPFSSKHLHLCFKHRANDVLPPFQGLNSIEKDHLSIKKDVQNLALDVENRESIESKKGKEIRSTRQEVEIFGDMLESNPTEELLVSAEKMAPKVCPVCKTFSSPSNTALNAHIDRCLSGESTSKQRENFKVAKHKMKVRKMRSLAYIYAASMEWTLEDLDRRNGTNWAIEDTIQDDVVDEKCPSSSYVNSEDDKDEDDVYVDSNGTKLRILSRFGCLQSKLKQEEKLKHPKYRLSQPRSLTRTRNGYCLEVNNSRRSKTPLDDNKDGSPGDWMASTDFGMVKQWVGSKRTIARKKINLECNEFNDHHQSPRLHKRDIHTMIGSGFHQGKKKDLSEQSRKEDPSLDERCLDPWSMAENEGSSQHNKSHLFSTRMHRDVAIGGSPDGSLLESNNYTANVLFHNQATSDVEVNVGGEAFTIFGKSMKSGVASGSNGPKDYVKGYYSKCNSGDYIVDVDPILIPGPPGSFLPSPGYTGSEEIQGDSSLTACKVRSSEGEVELIDMNSLDSPISSRLDSNFDNSMLFKNTRGLSSRDLFNNQVFAPTFPSLEENCGLLGPNGSTMGNARIEVPQDSKLVLRLMGKNLTVVNGGENQPSLKMRANFGMPDLPPNNPSGGVTTFYDIYRAECFPRYNLCRVSQDANARAMPFEGLTENSSGVHPKSLMSASMGLTATSPISSSTWFPHGFSMSKN